MENKNIITIIVAVMIGVAFLGSLVSITLNNINLIEGNENDNEISFTDGEHILDIIGTYSNAICEDIEIYNSTGGEEVIGNGNFTFISDNCTYVVQTDSAYKDSNVNISYNYESEPDEYINNSATRNLIKIVLGLFGLFILAFIITFIMHIFGEKI